jgi:hypothetical protein
VSNPRDIRISDAEREDAVRALGEHMSAGRLDIEEYGERTAKVAATKTRGDLLGLFSDLPEPTPHWPDVDLASAGGPATNPVAQSGLNAPLAQRLSATLVPLALLVALVMFFTVAKGLWLVFLLPAAVALLSGSLAGASSSRDQRRRSRRYR